MTDPERILITGATGFLGSRLVHRLRADSVEHWTTSRGEFPEGSSRWIGADLLVAEEVDRLVDAVRPDLVFHLAGNLRPGGDVPEGVDPYAVHRCGTRNLLASLRRGGKESQVLVVGSSAVYGVLGAAGEPFDEDSPTNPQSPYARSKLCQEQEALAAEPAAVCIVRPYNLLGRGQPRGLFARDLLDELRERRGEGAWWEENPGRFSAVRDFVDVDDVADALAWLAARETLPRCVDVCSGEGTHLVTVLEELCRLEGLAFRGIPREVTSWQVGKGARMRELGWSSRIPLVESLRNLREGVS